VFIPTPIPASIQYILLGGGFTQYNAPTLNRIAKIDGNGNLVLDSTFNPGAGFNNTVHDIQQQPDGKYVTVGVFTNYSGSTVNRIVRMNQNGTRDTTFNVGTGLAGSGLSLALQSDGKIICANASQTYSGSTARYLIRINPSGTLDDTFNANVIPTDLSLASSTPNGLAIDSNGSIYWGNAFTTYSGSFIPNRIVRLNTNGSVDETFNQAFPNYINNTGKGANNTVNALLLI